MCKLCDKIRLSPSFVQDFSLKCFCGKEHVASKRVTHDIRIDNYHHFNIDEPIQCSCGTKIEILCLPCDGDLVGGLFKGKVFVIGEDTTP